MPLDFSSGECQLGHGFYQADILPDPGCVGSEKSNVTVTESSISIQFCDSAQPPNGEYGSLEFVYHILVC